MPANFVWNKSIFAGRNPGARSGLVVCLAPEPAWRCCVCYDGDHETGIRHDVQVLDQLVRRTVHRLCFSTVHAVGDAHKVSVVSFGLFGDQGVFRSEATGAAEVVAGRFGGGPINVKYNSKKGGGATIETLDMSLQAAANGMDAENDFCF